MAWAVLFASLLLAGATRAQAPAVVPPRFEHLGVEDGLSQGTVNSIYQDRRGFLWFGTNNGLNRYDGHTVVAYQNVPFDSTSFRGGSVSAIAETRDGAIWVGATNGLSRLDPATGRFHHVRFARGNRAAPVSGNVASLHEDRSGALWVGSSDGLTRLDPVTGEFRRFFHDANDPLTLTDDAVGRITEGRGRVLWIGSRNGLNRLDPVTGRVTRFLYSPVVPAQGPPPPGVVRTPSFTLDPDEPDVLWFGGQGLSRFDTRTGRLTRLLPELRRPLADVRNTVGEIAVDPTDPNVFWMTTRIIGTIAYAGLLRFDRRTGRFDRFQRDPADPFSLSTDQTLRVYTDRSGVVWIGTTLQGLNRFDPLGGAIARLRPGRPFDLPSDVVYSVIEARDGALWMGVARAVARLDRRTGVYRHYRHDPNDPASLGTGNYLALLEDRAGQIWVGTGDGLDRLDTRTGRVTHVYHDPDDPNTPTAGPVEHLFEDRDGALWISTNAANGGLNRLDPATGRITRYQNDPANPRSLSANAVQGVYRDHQGVLWVHTGAGPGQEGLNRLDERTGTFTRFLHDDRDTTTLATPTVFAVRDRAREPGVLWVGTLGGLDRLDVRTGRFTHFTTRDGLPDQTIYAIIEDGAGHLWLSTNRGIARFEPETRRFTRYGPESGLPAMEFNRRVAFRSPSGELFFGGAGGLSAFFPDRLRPNTIPPQVALTGLRLFNRPVAPSEKGPLRKPLMAGGTLRLDHDENNVTFEYVGLHFKAPEANRYRYRLEGFDPAWVEAGARREATYTNLPPGHYTFRVTASNADGVWSPHGVSLGVVVAPPWWRTLWAYLVYALLFGGAVSAVDRVQRRRLVARERARAERAQAEAERAQARVLAEAYAKLDASHRQLKATQQQLVQQEKLASLGALTAGIAHEIKNPLNFVNNFAALSEELVSEIKTERTAHPDLRVADVDDLLDDLRSNAARIREHGQRADSIVKNMLAHSRGNAGAKEAVDVNSLLDEYTSLAYHGMRAQRPDFTCTVERALEASAAVVQAVPQDLSRVFLNLLSNAFYAVARRRDEAGDDFMPLVRVSTRSDDGHVEASVWDNGGGIPEAVQARIFEPFFTTKPTGEGTGLGLSLSHDIVAAHGGCLDLTTEAGEWTRFTVRLPMGAPPQPTATAATLHA